MFPPLAQVLGAPLGFTRPGITCQHHLNACHEQDTVVSTSHVLLIRSVRQGTGEYDDGDDDIAQLDK